MFSQACVKNSVPPRQTPPYADLALQTPLGRHSWADTPPPQQRPSRADTLPGRHSPGRRPRADTLCPVHARIHTPLAQCMLGYTPQPSACWDTVNKRAVRLLLECILFFFFFCSHVSPIRELLLYSVANWLIL